MKPQCLKAFEAGQATRLVVLEAIIAAETAPAVAEKTGLPRSTVQVHISRLLDAGVIREAGKRTEQRLVKYSTMTYERTSAPITASGQASQRLASCFFGATR